MKLKCEWDLNLVDYLNTLIHNCTKNNGITLGYVKASMLKKLKVKDN